MRPTISLVSWNVERLATHLGTPDGMRAVYEMIGRPDILCLQEIRLRAVDEALLVSARSALPSHAFDCSLPNDARNVTFRGGRAHGVATWVANELGAVSFEHATWDREGRVLVTLLHEERIAIVNLYAVNGTSKPWLDEEGNAAGDRHALKGRFQAELLDLGRRLRRRGLDLVMVGDWNVSRSKVDVTRRLRTEKPHVAARAHLNDELIPELDLVDAFRELHPHERCYTWIRRGTHGKRLDAARVDYALVSKTLLSRIEIAEIDSRPEARFTSDHAPIGLVWRSER